MKQKLFQHIVKNVMLKDIIVSLHTRQIQQQRLNVKFAGYDMQNITIKGEVIKNEDAAQAHGAEEKTGRKAGNLSNAAAFSFYPTKNLGALGDGGAIVTNDAALAERVKHLRQYGWTTRYLQALPGGRNSRLDELQAGFLSVFLPSLDERNAKRRQIVKQYLESGATFVHEAFVNSERNVAHLELVMANPEISGSGLDLSDLTAAINSGKAELANH